MHTTSIQVDSMQIPDSVVQAIQVGRPFSFLRTIPLPMQVRIRYAALRLIGLRYRKRGGGRRD